MYMCMIYIQRIHLYEESIRRWMGWPLMFTFQNARGGVWILGNLFATDCAALHISPSSEAPGGQCATYHATYQRTVTPTVEISCRSPEGVAKVKLPIRCVSHVSRTREKSLPRDLPAYL